MPFPKFQLHTIFVGSSAHRSFKVCCFLFLPDQELRKHLIKSTEPTYYCHSKRVDKSIVFSRIIRAIVL